MFILEEGFNADTVVLDVGCSDASRLCARCESKMAASGALFYL